MRTKNKQEACAEENRAMVKFPWNFLQFRSTRYIFFNFSLAEGSCRSDLETDSLCTLEVCFHSDIVNEALLPIVISFYYC